MYPHPNCDNADEDSVEQRRTNCLNSDDAATGSDVVRNSTGDSMSGTPIVVPTDSKVSILTEDSTKGTQDSIVTRESTAGDSTKGTEDSIVTEETATAFPMPMGWRFIPTDEELVLSYLCNKVAGRSLPAKVINEVDASEFYMKHPRELDLDMEADGQITPSWYLFIKNDKYFHGKVEKKQAVGDGKIGFWRFAGKEEPLYDSDGKNFACKIRSTFFSSKRKTDWNMEQYRLTKVDLPEELPREEWVVARITRGVRILPNC